MILIPIISILVRLAAVAWSVLLLRRLRDRRMGVLTVLLAVLAAEQILRFVARLQGATAESAGPAPELIALAVSAAAILVVVSFERIPGAARAQRRAGRPHEKAPNDVELRDRGERLRAIVDTAAEGIVTIDERGIVESFNAAAEKIFGYRADEVIGKNVSILMPPSYGDHHDGYIANYLRTGQRKIIGIGREVAGRRKDGSTFPMSLAVSESVVAGGRLFTGIVRDNSQQRRLEEQILEVGTRERQRIGRDLHDGLGQELTGIGFLADVLRSQLARAQHPEVDNAGEIAGLVRQAIEHARGLVKGLCPVHLEADGLMQSFDDLAETVRRVYGIACVFDCPEPVPVHRHGTAMHLYYIGHEAVHNAIRHGRPRSVTIRLAADGDEARLSVVDDGVGLGEESGERSGSGLQIMRYRAKMIDGTLDVASNPGAGVTVSCRFAVGSGPGAETE